MAVALAGIGYGAVNPATNVLSTSLVPRRHRALFLSVKQTGVTLGGLVAGAVLPGLADAVGWRAALLLPIAMMLDERARRGLGGGSRGPRLVRRAGLGPRRDRSRGGGRGTRGATTGLFGFVMSGVQLSVAGYLTVYLVDTKGFSKPTAGPALGVAFAAACAGRVIWGWISDRYFLSHASTLVIVSAGSLLGLVSLSIGPSHFALWIACALVGFCSFGWNGVYMALITDRAAGRNLGHATGRGLMFLYGGVVLVPPTLGAVKDGFNSWSAAWAVAACFVLAAVTAMAFAPRHRVLVGSVTQEPAESPVGAAV